MIGTCLTKIVFHFFFFQFSTFPADCPAVFLSTTKNPSLLVSSSYCYLDFTNSTNLQIVRRQCCLHLVFLIFVSLFCLNWFLYIIAFPKQVNMPLDNQPITWTFLLDDPEVSIIAEDEFMSLPGDDLLNLWRGSPKGQLQGEKGRLPLHRKGKVWNGQTRNLSNPQLATPKPSLMFLTISIWIFFACWGGVWVWVWKCESESFCDLDILNHIFKKSNLFPWIEV